MIVFGPRWPADQPLTSPFPLRNGLFFALRGGDHAHPSYFTLRPEATAGQEPGWFNAIPLHVRRLYFPFPVLPFLSARWGRFGFYVGWKAFGVDSEQYKDFPGVNPNEVFAGSVALQGCTIRFTRGL